MSIGTLTPPEENAMRETFWATMLRCADIIDKITPDDVLEAQAVMLASGVSLERVAKLDRALLASSHIRACVKVSKDKVQTEVLAKSGVAK